MKNKGARDLKISVLIPTYNMAKTIGDTVRSVLNQTHQNFEIIVQDNDSSDETINIIKSFRDKRVLYFKNRRNHGYAKNLIAGSNNCTGDIVYFLGADDILALDALERINRIFLKYNKAGAVTRSYFWFQENINVPIRVTPILNPGKDEVVSIDDFKKAVYVLHNEILGQMSGLAFRRKFLTEKYFTEENDWIAHGYPFVNIFKLHPVVFMKDFPVAIRIGGNTIRQKGSNLYLISPTRRWIEMLKELLHEKKYIIFREYFIKEVIARNYLGLIQIKCYSGFRHLMREILYLVKYNWLNLFSARFWFFSLSCIIIPQSILPTMVDHFKNRVNSRLIPRIDFKYNIS